jgi:GAF domain-containing protein
MKEPPTPSDEAERLEALEALALLDTDDEECFDAVTRIVRRPLDVPIALVTLVARDRQRFKSNQGLALRQTPRRTSCCGHAISSNNSLVVRDTGTDERLADNPLVTGNPAIGFYAGAPLRVNSRRIGAFCVLDRRPQNVDDEDIIASLEDPASIITPEMSSWGYTIGAGPSLRPSKPAGRRAWRSASEPRLLRYQRAQGHQ